MFVDRRLGGVGRPSGRRFIQVSHGLINRDPLRGSVERIPSLIRHPASGKIVGPYKVGLNHNDVLSALLQRTDKNMLYATYDHQK
jgi:hypothetical protein